MNKKPIIRWAITVGNEKGKDDQTLVANTKEQLKEMADRIGWRGLDFSKAQKIQITKPE